MTKKSEDLAAATNSAVKSSFEHEFKVPLPYGPDKTLEKVTIRRPMGGDLRGVKLAMLQEIDAGVLFALLPRITTPLITEAHVQKIDPIDTVTIMVGINDFFSA